MKRAIFLASLIATPVFAQAPAANANPGVGGVKAVFNGFANNLVRAAEQMSEADFAYKPVATVRTFGQIIGHVAGANFMICAAALGEPGGAEDDIEKSKTTKADLIAALKASNEYCARAYALTDAQAAGMTKLFGQDQTKMFALSLNAAHGGEHYGNIVTYMRMKGMVPPSSQGQ